MKGVKIDQTYSIINNNNNVLMIYNHETNECYPFSTKEEIPKTVKGSYTDNNFSDALQRYYAKRYDEFNFDEDIISKINKIPKKNKIHYSLSAKNQNMMLDKTLYQDYFRIYVNKNNPKHKYYYNKGRYELLSEFQLGYLIEKNFTILTSNGEEHPLCLPDSDLHTLYGMFRNIKLPNPDLIRFNNVTLNTLYFTVVAEEFTIKNIYYDYYDDLSCCETDTLVEKVLREIMINKENNNDLYYIDFLERVGACFLRQNKHKFMYMLNGSGDDGKSIILYILSLVFGDLSLFLNMFWKYRFYKS